MNVMKVSSITNTRMQEENDSKNTLMNDIVACKTQTVIYLFMYSFIYLFIYLSIYIFLSWLGKITRVAMGKNRAGAFSK